MDIFETLKGQLHSLAEQYKQFLAGLQNKPAPTTTPTTTTTPPATTSTPTTTTTPTQETPKKETPVVAVSNISGSVGYKGTNNPADVKLVQQLLNKKINAGLVEDGDCGKLTINAIAKFQQNVVKLAKPDGRIDAGGKTWQALSGNTTTTPPANTTTNPTTPTNTTPVVVVPTGQEIPNPSTPAANAVLPKATEIDRSGAWSKNKKASMITATPEQVQEVMKKANSAGSPCFLEVRPMTKVANPAEIPADVAAYVKGKSQVPRTKQDLNPGGALDKTFGNIDRTKIGSREKGIPADKDAAAAFESKHITYISTPLFKNKIGVNKKVAASLKMALDEVFNFYGGAEGCKAFGLTSGYGWNFRNITGGSKPSTHAWGIAIDICADLNPYGVNGDAALFMQPTYQPFLDIMEKYGWFSLARYWNGNDAMHFQATTLG